MSEWKSSACILCECNCGIKVQTGGEDGRHIVRIRGDEAHPGSEGYLCQKASGLNFYQNGKDRLDSPLRKRADGSFEAIDWDTAISEIAEKMTAIRDQHGGDKIFYYGGGGQGNHLPGAYSAATRKVLGSQYRSNALAQEKTGEFWVNAQMFGGHVKGDFEHCEVALFIGKNPWHSHGIQRARALLRDIGKDPKRSTIVIDPVATETAKLADYHLQLKPGTDAWLLSAMVAILVQDELYDREWLQQHSSGLEELLAEFSSIDIAAYCETAQVEESLVREAVARIVAANGVACFEDLGVQMNRHSTLNSYLEKLLWALCGQFGNEGGQYIPLVLQNVAGSGRSSRVSPVVGAPIISGLVPCNVIADEILSDHPDRYRAMLVETANPVHSLADTNKMKQALSSLDLVVVIDIAMTETARLADYILPAANQFEKWEATFFNFEFPNNYFHLRAPLFDPLENTLPEAEIHARLVEAMGAMPEALCEELGDIMARSGRDAYRDRLLQAMAEDPSVSAIAPVLLYRTLGPSLANGASEGAVLWPLALNFAMSNPDQLRRAGYEGSPFEQADALFDAIISSPSGAVFSVDTLDEVWQRLGNEGRINLLVPELLEELKVLEVGESKLNTAEFPFVLMAGERRDYSANTIYRDPGWRRKDRDGSLRINPVDAEALGLVNGGEARLSTKVGSAVAVVEITDRMQSGHLSLPNGFGLDNDNGERTGVAINELTNLSDRDPFAGTPWHKYVAARVEAV